jgi:hypothetical protein
LATKELVVASRQRTDSRFRFHQGIFDQRQHGCRPHPTSHFSVSQLEIKLKGRHFDTNQAIEAESQLVQNTLTEHDFQDN